MGRCKRALRKQEMGPNRKWTRISRHVFETQCSIGQPFCGWDSLDLCILSQSVRKISTAKVSPKKYWGWENKKEPPSHVNPRSSRALESIIESAWVCRWNWVLRSEQHWWTFFYPPPKCGTRSIMQTKNKATSIHFFQRLKRISRTRLSSWSRNVWKIIAPDACFGKGIFATDFKLASSAMKRFPAAILWNVDMGSVANFPTKYPEPAIHWAR